MPENTLEQRLTHSKHSPEPGSDSCCHTCVCAGLVHQVPAPARVAAPCPLCPEQREPKTSQKESDLGSL